MNKRSEELPRRGLNTFIFHTVTSFVVFNCDQRNNVQNTDPWLYSELPESEYKELFSLNSGMVNEIHKKLTDYLTIILEELCIEKNQETNVIDELICHQSRTGYGKKRIAQLGKHLTSIIRSEFALHAIINY